jgi:hypothetical protein
MAAGVARVQPGAGRHPRRLPAPRRPLRPHRAGAHRCYVICFILYSIVLYSILLYCIMSDGCIPVSSSIPWVRGKERGERARARRWGGVGGGGGGRVGGGERCGCRGRPQMNIWGSPVDFRRDSSPIRTVADSFPATFVADSNPFRRDRMGQTSKRLRPWLGPERRRRVPAPPA